MPHPSKERPGDPPILAYWIFDFRRGSKIMLRLLKADKLLNIVPPAKQNCSKNASSKLSVFILMFMCRLYVFPQLHYSSYNNQFLTLAFLHYIICFQLTPYVIRMATLSIHLF